MTDFGRIHAVSITNRNGSIIYERFYDRLSEIQKAELRTALGQCSRDVARMPNGHVGVGNFRCAVDLTNSYGMSLSLRAETGGFAGAPPSFFSPLIPWCTSEWALGSTMS